MKSLFFKYWNDLKKIWKPLQFLNLANVGAFRQDAVKKRWPVSILDRL